MDAAISYKRQHPSESYLSVSKRFGVAASTLHDRLKDTHLPRGHRGIRKLSADQEDALISEINAYADRGTLLTPQLIAELAHSLGDVRLGRNWTSSFLNRHKDKVSSRFYRVQDLARIKADTPETRAAFLTLVSSFMLRIHIHDDLQVKEALDTGLYLSSNIYNMDETGFELSTARRTRRVGPTNASIKAQASLAASGHITVIAAISTHDAPIPPFIIYSGGSLIDGWLETRDEDPKADGHGDGQRFQQHFHHETMVN